jgi:Domain of unknown function (DUF4372)
VRHHNTLLHDLLKPMPWGRFDRLVDKYGADKGVRRLSTKSQLVTLLHAQLSGATSLREIVTTFESHCARLYHLGVEAPRRSTLADANRDRPAEVFAELFEVILKQAHPGLRRHAMRPSCRSTVCRSTGPPTRPTRPAPSCTSCSIPMRRHRCISR